MRLEWKVRFRMDGRKLIYNAIRTPDGTVIESRGRHDYVTHTDATNGKEYVVDGGLDYIRCSNNGDEVILAKYDDEPHEVQRVTLRWGTYGKRGDQPLKLVTPAEMSNEHLQNIIDNLGANSVSAVYWNVFVQEIEYRKENPQHNISE